MSRRFKLTSERIETVCEAVAGAHTYAYAAAAAGISERSLYRYMTDADEALLRFEGDKELSEREALLCQFAMLLAEAQHFAEDKFLGRIKKASEDQWQAAAWIMERRWPENWSRSAKIKKEEERVIKIQMDLGAPTRARIIDAASRSALLSPGVESLETELEADIVAELVEADVA
jgi:hypothetical protein